MSKVSTAVGKDTHKLTGKHFQYFTDRVRYWQQFFGVTDWRIDIRQHDLGEALAAFNCTYRDRTVVIFLNTGWNEPPVPIRLDKSAFHEVCEVLLVDVGRLAHYDFNSETVDEKIHAIIRLLENAVFPKCR